MYLQAIASAVPPVRFTQGEVLRELKRTSLWGTLHGRSQGLLEKILSGESGIETRHFAHAEATTLLTADAQSLNELFEQTAPALATQALTKALIPAGISAEEIDALFVCTCTGYLCPGLSSHIAERMGISAGAVLHDVVGLGCGAAIPTLRAAGHFLAAHPDAVAAVIAVEVCSAAFFLDDDPGVLISFCLFGDGASASLWRGREGTGAGWRARGFQSIHVPAEREKIRFVNDRGKLRNKLHRAVPAVAAAAVGELFAREKFNGSVDGLRVLAHGGGRDVLEGLRQAIPGQEFAESAAVLRDCGNMSSPSVLFALERALDAGESGPFWMTSFGAGFSAHSCRIER